MNIYELIQGTEHIGLGAKDTNLLASWYCEIFGLNVVFKSEDEIPIYFLSFKDEKFKIEIFPVDLERVGDSMIHFSFNVSSLKQFMDQLSQKGVEYSPIKYLMKSGKTVFFNDPVGHKLQVVERPIKLWE